MSFDMRRSRSAAGLARNVLWHRADLDGHPALVAGARCRLALHRAGQATAEWLQRELQRSAAG